MIGPGEAAAAQAAGRHVEVPAIFLDHDVARDLGGAEERMSALVDGIVFSDAVYIRRVGVVPARLQFLEGDGVGTVAIDLVGRHVDERGFGAETAGGLK